MAELMEPFERELRRSRSRMPLPQNLQRAFEDDMGRALAEMELRTGNARTYGALQPGDEAAGIIAREAPQQTRALPISEMIANPVREPENPDAVRRELIDPLVAAYGMDGRGTLPQRTVQPRIFEMGNQLVQIDSTTGRPTPIFTQEKAAPEMTPRQKLEYSDLLKQRQTLMGKQFQSAADKQRMTELDSQISSFFAPTAAVPPVPEAAPRAFMGDPLAQPAPAEAPAAPPVAKRVKNSTYSTPKGILKWTGTGWVKP